MRHAAIAMSELTELQVTEGALDNQQRSVSCPSRHTETKAAVKALEAAFLSLDVKNSYNKHPELENSAP